MCEAQIDYAWGGTLDFSFDTMPHVAQDFGRWFALGCAGHGVAIATPLGSTAAMLGGGSRSISLHEILFPRAPLGAYNGWPWFLPFVGLRDRILDWIE